MSGRFTLYDLPSREPNQCWSLNPWKTRMLFNFKGFDYTTQWVEYPDIAPTLKGHVPPNPQGSQGWDYTIPAVQFPDGRYIMESKAIALQVEKEHPTPSARLDSPSLATLEETINGKLFVACRGLIIASVPKNLLNPASVTYWMPNRAKICGAPVEEFAAEHGGPQAIQNTGEIFGTVGEQLKKNGGPFFDGETVGYADFVWAGVLLFFKRIDEKLFQDLLAASGDADVHNRLLDACAPWTKRNDH